MIRNIGKKAFANLALIACLLTPALAFGQVVEIESDPDYRYRDVNGLFFGPSEDLDQILEIYLGDDGFDTRVGLEFPIREVTSCNVVTSATLTLTTQQERVGSDSDQVDIFGFEGNGIPTVDNVADPLIDPLATYTADAFLNVIDLPAQRVNELFHSGATHIGLALAASDVMDTYLIHDADSGPAPLLTLTCDPFAPVPTMSSLSTTILVVMSLLLGLVVLRRKAAMVG